MKRWKLLATTAAVGLSLSGGAAFAQSTATQVEEVVVTGVRARSTEGLATQVNEAKDVSVIGSQFIETQQPSANFAQIINVLPGVNYMTEDPGGFNSGDLRIHGFDGNHIGVILDGAPLNDTGNYATFPGEYMVGELIDHITTNIGSSDVDSPSASALGASVNIVTKTPLRDFGARAKVSVGNNHYWREYAQVDTGELNSTGLRAYFAGEYGSEDNFKDRPGYSRKWDLSFKVYQPMPKEGDFMSLSGIYTSQRQFPAFRAFADQLAVNPYYVGDNADWIPLTVRSGLADTVPSLPRTFNNLSGSDSNFIKLFPNPVDFASIRGQSKWTLSPNLTWTFDPNYLYTLANGGGSATLRETDKRLIGSALGVTGRDVNGDGDTLDTVVIYQPSDTHTQRFGLTTSLLWDPSEMNHFRLAYTADYGRHRQTGRQTTVDPLTGEPDSVFGGYPGLGRAIQTADFHALRSRDRLSIAELNQISANYIGRFMDSRLRVNLGVRAPFMKRALNQYCYTFNGSSAYCDTISQQLVLNAYNTDLAAHRNPGQTATALTTVLGSSNISTGPGGIPNFRFPFHQIVKYDKVLPNAGISYKLGDHHLFYASYASGFAAPKTDNLYTSTPQEVRTETSDNYAAGYRYQASNIQVSLNFYDTEYKNRIVQSVDPTDPTLSIDRNVGDVRVRGIDLEAGWTPIEKLHLYGSANWNDSEVLKNYVLSASNGAISFQLPVKGKKLVLTPDEIYSTRVSYDFTEDFTVGVQGKYMGERFLSDINDISIKPYAVWNADFRATLPWWDKRAYL
ncbi:MAG TPA: TonB-dependent receptor, partial [Caulobacteraceae bacterium]|nr:TonB-dependent receptor [Caulobacteraceae bacterium]